MPPRVGRVQTLCKTRRNTVQLVPGPPPLSPQPLTANWSKLKMQKTIFTIYHSKSDVGCSKWLPVPSYTMSWHTYQGQGSSELLHIRPCLVNGDDAPWNILIQCISVQNVTCANSRLPTSSIWENDITIIRDVSKSNWEEVRKSAVQTNDKKSAAGNLISETRKKQNKIKYELGQMIIVSAFCYHYSVIH
jgi:hypothetical protein